MGGGGGAVGGLIDDWTALFTVHLMVMFPQEAIILAYLCDSCEEFMSAQLAVVLGWLGIEATDTITVQMQDNKLIQDTGFYKNLMTQVALEHEFTQLGIIELLSIKSQGVRGSIQKFSRYGKDTYLDGLPSTSINSVAVNKDVIDAAITAERGFAISIINVHIKVPTEAEWVAYKMTTLYGYVASSQLFMYGGSSYMLTGFYYNYTTGNYMVQAYMVSTPTTTISLAIGNYVPSMGYVTTYIQDGTTNEYYWIYFIGSGSTALDNARNYLTNLDMLPIIELRRNKINTNSDKNSTRYKHTSEILGFIGIDVDTITESLNSNPSISSVNAAYIYFGAEIGSNNPLQAKMVYSTLEYLWLDPSLVSTGSNQIRVSEGAYNTSISWDKQERVVGIRTGVPIGTYEGGVSTISVVDTHYANEGILYTDIDLTIALDLINDSNGEPRYFYSDGTVASGYFFNSSQIYVYLNNGYSTSTSTTNSKHYGWVRKQETSDEYVEYRVYNVSATTLIMNGVLYDIAFRILSPTQTIVMPISQHFFHMYSPIEQGKLFPEILRLVTYSSDITHLAYYQTPAFMNLIQVIVVIIAIVIFIFTWYDGGFTASGFIAAVETLLVGMAVGYALQLLLSQVSDPKLRAVLAMVAVVAMAAYGSTQGMEQSITSITANMVTEAVSNYSEAIMESVAEQFSNLSMESMMFASLLDKRQLEVEEKMSDVESMVSTADVARIANLENVNGYIEGVDLRYYRAIEMQYAWDLSKSMKPLIGIYDYDLMYKVGVQ